jgi:hypothetical protein
MGRSATMSVPQGGDILVVTVEVILTWLINAGLRVAIHGNLLYVPYPTIVRSILSTIWLMNLLGFLFLSFVFDKQWLHKGK